MPDQFGHYRALLSAVAALAGTQQSGVLPKDVVERFPLDLRGATVGDPRPMTPNKLSRRLDQLAEFAAAQPICYPSEARPGVPCADWPLRRLCCWPAKRTSGPTWPRGRTTSRCATGTPTSTTRGSTARPTVNLPAA